MPRNAGICRASRPTGLSRFRASIASHPADRKPIGGAAA